jgi:hypothetical protein
MPPAAYYMQHTIGNVKYVVARLGVCFMGLRWVQQQQQQHHVPNLPVLPKLICTMPATFA